MRLRFSRVINRARVARLIADKSITASVRGYCASSLRLYPFSNPRVLTVHPSTYKMKDKRYYYLKSLSAARVGADDSSSASLSLSPPGRGTRGVDTRAGGIVGGGVYAPGDILLDRASSSAPY